MASNGTCEYNTCCSRWQSDLVSRAPSLRSTGLTASDHISLCHWSVYLSATAGTHYIHACTHTQTRTHRHTRTHTRTRTHTHTHTHTDAGRRTCAPRVRAAV